MTAMHPSTQSSPLKNPISASSNSPPEAAKRFLEYVDASPTPFHATATSARMLEEAGFVKLKEDQVWDGNVEAGGKY